jgi:assimilatory nitrate reductase catalytic subunit
VVDRIGVTTGRTAAHYLSGNQTRRIGYLVDQTPRPRVELHPAAAADLGVADGDAVRVESRRGEAVLPAMVVSTVRPDTGSSHTTGRRRSPRTR